MFDHVGLTVKDLARSAAFYAAALAPLGIRKTLGFPGSAAFGAEGRSSLWISEGQVEVARPRVHLAFTATRPQVESFYAAALAAGGSDNGAPGPRPHYGEHTYGAFVLDPDGHNIEAVCHDPPGGARTTAAKRKPAKGKTAARKTTRRETTKRTTAKTGGRH